MAKIRASSDALGKLHQKLAEVMIEALDGEEFEDPDTGEVTRFKANNPALFTAVAKFLKDNDIVAIPESESATNELMEKLKETSKNAVRPRLPDVKPEEAEWPNANQKS